MKHDRFVDDANSPTEAYPFNPNGSPDGIAGLCSEDGRHLAVMPHPERCFLTWQVGPDRNRGRVLFMYLFFFFFFLPSLYLSSAPLAHFLHYG